MTRRDTGCGLLATLSGGGSRAVPADRSLRDETQGIAGLAEMFRHRIDRMDWATAVAVLLALLIAVAPASLWAQGTPPPNAPPPAAPTAVFSPEELDQMLAPVALYPDALLAQVLMAASYPLDVIAADRWVQAPPNAQLRGDALAAALDQQPWDPSVKSLVPFPQVLRMMDERVDWMQRLGDAFLAQPDDVMAAVQRLRAAAEAAGNLATTPQQVVERQESTIVIVPANPEMIYVPVYNPVVIYGVWPYPAYPPIYLPPPPGFFVSGFFFGVGVAIVAPYWGWSNFDWRRHDIHIDRDRFNRINHGRPPVNADVWRHDPSRRGAVPYRDPATRARYQRPPPGPAPQTRQQFRGFSPAQPGQARPATPPKITGRVPTAQPTPPGTPPKITGRVPTTQPTQPGTPPKITGRVPTTQPLSRPPKQPQLSRLPAQPQTVKPTVPAPSAVRPPLKPQVIRPTSPQSAFQPTARGSDARTYSQRGQQSRQTPVAPMSTAPRAAPHLAPAPSRGSAPIQRQMPSGGAPGGGHR